MKIHGITHLVARRALTALVLPAAALAVLVLPAAAQAASGGDPQATGCAGSQVTDLSTNMYDPNNGWYMGTEYLRYSRNCSSEWVTVDYANGYRAQPSVWIQNRSGTNLYTARDNGAAVWTYQLINMKYTAACGGAQMYDSSGRWVAWEYIGCE